MSKYIVMKFNKVVFSSESWDVAHDWMLSNSGEPYSDESVNTCLVEESQYNSMLTAKAEDVVQTQYTKCWVCGEPFDGLTVPFLREKGVCSNYCLEDAGWDYS